MVVLGAVFASLRLTRNLQKNRALKNSVLLPHIPQQTYPNSVCLRTDVNCHQSYDPCLAVNKVNIMNSQKTLSHQVGVWIDHREAFVVFSNEPTIKEHSISSGIEKHIRVSGHGAESAGVAEDQRERHLEQSLDRYYDDVIEFIHDATAIFIFGPGEAKGEFKKRIEHKGLGDRITGVEAANNLTNNQIAAKVQDFFHK